MRHPLFWLKKLQIKIPKALTSYLLLDQNLGDNCVEAKLAEEF